MVEISVVIPTFERMDVLPEVLDALEAQEGAPDFEIVVVDDGSADDTPAFLAGREFRMPAKVVRQENSGPARARNRGVEEAVGRRVAFLGDDTVPSSGWLRAHHEAARRRSEEPLLGVIGYTGWHPRMRLDPFLEHINENGLQFGYALIEDPENVPFNFLYTSNLSLPRQALIEEPFDLAFPYAAWEDTELGYRLRKRGLRLVYEASATVAHDHPTHLGRFMQRQEKAGYAAVVFHGLHPELGDFLGVGEGGPPPLPRRWRQQALVALARMLHPLRWKTPRLWEEILRYCYIQGLHRGWRERVVEAGPAAVRRDGEKGGENP
ncbi:MAG: glycosyltransferase [Holophagales bacterium]|nr:glycosyltransferase [Holophagales bacterium]